MGDLKDTIDLIDSIIDGNPISRNKLNNAKYTSIAKMASEGTLQFPVLVSSSLDIETAQNISKALERNYTTFVQTALSLFPSMNVNTPGGVNAKNFIKQFHQNDMVDTFDLVANLVEGKYDTILNGGQFVLESAMYNASTRNLVAKNKEQLIDLIESVRTDILNNKYIPKTEITYNFKDKELNKKYNSLLEVKQYNQRQMNRHRVRQDTANYEYRKAQDKLTNEFNHEKFDYQKSHDEKIDKMNSDKFNYQRVHDYQKDMHQLERERIEDDRYNEKTRYQRNRDEYTDRINQNSGDYLKNVLVDNDVKKANELIATTLHIRVKLFNDAGTSEGSVDFIIGVKCIMHPVKSEEMISNLVGACTNNDKVFNFLRWTTGEISFFKDFLFNIKEIKEDVANRRNGSSGWWLALKKRRLLGKSKRTILSNNQLLPNATIVINAEEAAYIKTQYGYDLHNPLFINKIMDQYYLLGFVIVDVSAQVAEFIFENDKKNYQTVTFSALEKSGSNDERKFKEMLKAVNRF